MRRHACDTSAARRGRIANGHPHVVVHLDGVIGSTVRRTSPTANNRADDDGAADDERTDQVAADIDGARVVIDRSTDLDLRSRGATVSIWLGDHPRGDNVDHHRRDVHDLDIDDLNNADDNDDDDFSRTLDSR